MNKDSYMVKRHKHRCGRLGLITNTLLASAGAGTVAFLVTAIVFQADGLVAFLMAYVAACMAAVINPLWLLGRG